MLITERTLISYTYNVDLWSHTANLFLECNIKLEINVIIFLSRVPAAQLNIMNPRMDSCQKRPMLITTERVDSQNCDIRKPPWGFSGGFLAE